MDQTVNSELQYCAYCSGKLPANEWCPIMTERDADDKLRVRSFCDETCKDRWMDDDDSGLDTDET